MISTPGTGRPTRRHPGWLPLPILRLSASQSGRIARIRYDSASRSESRTTERPALNVDVSTDVVINRPPANVSAYASDPDHVPAWYKNIKSVEWKTDRSIAVGSRIAFVAQFLGRRLAYTSEIAEFIPGERLVMRTTDGPFPMETTYTWQPMANDRTRMTLRNRGTPTGFTAWVAPFMAYAMRRANRKDLALLKRLLEDSGVRT